MDKSFNQLIQFEKDCQNYLNEWDNVKKLSAPQQLDLLKRSANFIDEFNINKFANKMEHLYNNLDEEIKIEFYRIFKRFIPRRFAGLELGLENRLTSKNPQELEFGLVILTMFARPMDETELLVILTKYISILKTIVHAYLSDPTILKNPMVMFLCLRKLSAAVEYLPRNNSKAIYAGFLEIYEKVIEAILPLKNYPTNDAEQKQWWNIRINILGCLRTYSRIDKLEIKNNILAFFDYLTEEKIVIPDYVRRQMLESLFNLVRYSNAATKRCFNYWDWIIVPGIQFKPEELAHLDETQYAVERIKKDEKVYIEVTGFTIVPHLLKHSFRSRIVEKIIQGLNSEGLLIKCAMLRVLPHLFAIADYIRDHVEQIIKTNLIPSFDHSHVAIRTLACNALSALNSERLKRQLRPMLPVLVDRLLDLLLRDKFYVKYHAIAALNRFAVRLDDEHLIESKILESHFREMASVNNLVPLRNITSLLKSNAFVHHAPMFLRDALKRACDLMGMEDEEEANESSEYFRFAKDIFKNERVVASKATLQAIEPIIVQFLEHPVFKRPNLLEELYVIDEVMDVLGYATFYIPVITKEFWDAFRIVFTLFQRVEADMCREFLVPMGNYVARAPAHFLENPNATNVVLDKLSGMNMREKLEGWELLVEVVSNLGMSDPKVVSGTLDIIVKIMDERPRPVVLLHIFRVLWAVMYVDPQTDTSKTRRKASQLVEKMGVSACQG